MKYLTLALFMSTALSPRLWGVDSVGFTCTSQIFDAKDFQMASNNGIVDIGKVSVIPSKLSFVSTFSFTRNGAANCVYKMENINSQVLDTKNFVYPGAGDNSTVVQMEQKFRAFVIPLRFTGLLQYEEFISNQPLKSVLSAYTELPTPAQDRYLQFKKEDPLSTTVVVTDSNEEKILYRIVVPKTVVDPNMYDKMIDNFKNALKAQGKTDDQIAILLPSFQKVVDRMKGQTQALDKRPQFAQFETYSYEP
jgi:hypothetical protein